MSFPVPAADGMFPRRPELVVPDAVSGNKIPDWTYKEFEVLDLLHSKIGIAAATGILSFGILVFINPPFVQTSEGSGIEVRRPSLEKIGWLSFASCVTVLVVSLR
ncbi:unknown [Feldmannia species virus]|uniref:Uncharacterized protein n=1 Tax=Feldmannia species virus TaxID=39420 RepID=B5LWI9_9PHYC|nr:hypothetical protein FeldSpV_gp100 [Feldmannia species virus]ACH46852.1 unknown [Feldmannia species virus]